MQGRNSGWSRWRRFDSVQNVNFVSGTNPGLPRTTVPASLPIRPFFCMLPSFPPADFGSKPQFPLCSDALGGYRSIDCVWRVWSCSSATGVLSIFFFPSAPVQRNSINNHTSKNQRWRVHRHGDVCTVCTTDRQRIRCFSDSITCFTFTAAFVLRKLLCSGKAPYLRVYAIKLVKQSPVVINHHSSAVTACRRVTSAPAASPSSLWDYWNHLEWSFPVTSLRWRQALDLL